MNFQTNVFVAFNGDQVIESLFNTSEPSIVFFIIII